MISILKEKQISQMLFVKLNHLEKKRLFKKMDAFFFCFPSQLKETIY